MKNNLMQLKQTKKKNKHKRHREHSHIYQKIMKGEMGTHREKKLSNQKSKLYFVYEKYAKAENEYYF